MTSAATRPSGTSVTRVATRRRAVTAWGVAYLTLATLVSPALAGGPLVLRVAADGAADFRTIQAALDSVPADNARRVTVRVAPGLYEERLRIDQDRITLEGAGPERTRVRYWLPRTEYDKRYDRTGPAVVNVFGDDVVLRGLTIENTQTDTQAHAFAIYGQPQRFILDGCHVLSEGGDTVSLWNTSYGMYYHRGCRFRGGVDFVCPRGWCYVTGSAFESTNGSAMLWHDGHMDPRMKLVVRDSTLDGPEGTWLGRNHYPSRFYLLGCTFSERVADKPIGVVSDVSGRADAELFEQKHFHSCHRTGGDFAWHADNLAASPGAPRPGDVTPAWTFDGMWDPESTAPPRVTALETRGATVWVWFSEPVAGAEHTVVVRRDGSFARFVGGNGARALRFRGGTADAPPKSIEPHADRLHGVTARVVETPPVDLTLPEPTPRRAERIVLAGDSTVASYPAESPSQGWGWAFQRRFDGRVKVDNHAAGGRSSKSFRDEGRWAKALAAGGDYVFIQFGHNDNPGKGPERETDPAPGGSFRANLARFVEEARAAGAKPVLVTPPTRRFYGDDNLVRRDEGNVPYAQATLAVGRELGVPVIDLNRLTRELFDRLGPATSDWMQPVGDRTHWTPAGAERVAALVAGALAESVPELAELVEPAALSP